MRKSYRIFTGILAAALLFGTAAGGSGLSAYAAARSAGQKTETSVQTGDKKTETEAGASDKKSETEARTTDKNTESSARATDKKEESLPTWDLTELYKDTAAYERDRDEILNQKLPEFLKQLEQLKTVDDVMEALNAYDALSRDVSTITLYITLITNRDYSDTEAMELEAQYNMDLADYSQADHAMTKALLAMDDDLWDKLLSDKRAETYHHFLSGISEEKDHLLDDKTQKVVSEMESAARNIQATRDSLANSELIYDTIQDPDGNDILASDLNREAVLNQNDRDYRGRFLEAFYGAWGRMKDTFAGDMYAYTRLQEDIAAEYGYASVLERKLAEDELTVEDYNALLKGAREHTDPVRDWNQFKKEYLGLSELTSLDSISDALNYENREYTFEEAHEIIVEAVKPLGEDYAKLIDRAFTEGWIDAVPSETKYMGAFEISDGTHHPYVLVNFKNDFDSVDALAHELGHAAHEYYSIHQQESYLAGTTTILSSEVASTLNEFLLLDYMLQHAGSNQERVQLRMKMENFINSYFYEQSQYADFEQQFHQKVLDGESLTGNNMAELYYSLLSAYNPGVTNEKYYGYHWEIVPHFYDMFYVYKYALDVAVSAQIADKILAGDEHMTEKYREFLTKGSTASAEDLFKAMDVDISKPDYIEAVTEKFAQNTAELKKLLPDPQKSK